MRTCIRRCLSEERQAWSASVAEKNRELASANEDRRGSHVRLFNLMAKYTAGLAYPRSISFLLAAVIETRCHFSYHGSVYI